MNSLDIKIDSEKDLLKIFNDYLHDATCQDVDIRYDPEKGTLDIVFNRIVFNDISIGPFNKARCHTIKSNLHLKNLDYYNIFSKYKSKLHYLDECMAAEDKYIIKFHEGLKIEIKFSSSILGNLKDL